MHDNETAGSASLEVVEVNGIHIAIDPSIMAPHVQRLIRRGRLSMPEARYLGSIIEEGERFLELGGGIGYTSSLVAKQNKASSITTVEANPALIAAMRRTHAMNGVTATVMNAVVLTKKTSETVPFYIYEDFRTSSLHRHEGKVAEVVQVPVLSFQDNIHSLSPTMIMIDVEGGELALLQDADLEGVNKVYVELHKDVIGASGIKTIFDSLSRQGFFYEPRPSRHNVVLFRRLP